MDLLDGTPLTISIGDDTAIDIATLEIDVLTGSTPGVTVVEADPDRCCATVTLAACGSDDCSELIAIVNDHQPDDQDVVTDCFPLGFHEVTFTAVDGLENVSTCTVSFEVVDGTPPEITCPDPATFFADGDCQVTPPAATVFDNCDADPVVTVSPPVLEGSGFHTVTYTATDASGNTSSCTTVIEVRDVTPPALNCGVRLGACPGSGPVQSSVTVDCGQELCFTARASDACGPISLVDDLTGAGSISTPGTLVGSSLTHVFTTPGTHVVTWTATDGAGNTSTCSTVVRVLGSAAPDLECSPVSTLRNLVGDDDDFGSEDPGDAPMTGPGFPGCLGANPTELGMDSTDPNACRVWVHDYALPPDACVVDARLILDWEIRSRACGPCPAGNLRPTEHIQLASAAGAISFGRCFDPFAAVMYGDCPNPTSSGVTTLELSLFPGALDLLDGSPLTVAIGDDTLIDRAILEIDSVLAGSNTITVVTPPGGPCCATATVGSCATAGCEEIVSVTNDHDPSQGELVTDCFPLGITPVTFTVTDAGGGSSDCTVYVEVRNGGCSPPDGQATDPSGPVSSRTGRELQP
ncbi:MAG: HYR domain-containing protein [Acidobacteriota bacterium]